MSKFSDTQIKELGNFLINTSDELEYAMEELFEGTYSESDMEEDDYKRLSKITFKCPTCEWWYDASKLSKDKENCSDCYSEINRKFGDE